MFTEFERDVYEAPVTFVSKVGTKRAVYAEEDTIWTTIHITNETDTDKVEDALGTITYQQYDQFLLENKIFSYI